MERHSVHPILLFDGVCSLCEMSIQFIIKRDPKRIFRFVSLQSRAGQELLTRFKLPLENFNTMVLVEGKSYYTRSCAGFRIANRLTFPWSLLSVFLILPRFIRDAVYDFIANNRYRWFGKKETCMIPSPDLRKRFLE